MVPEKLESFVYEKARAEAGDICCKPTFMKTSWLCC